MSENMGVPFGVVAVNSFKGNWKVYIGVIYGDDEAFDAQHVAAVGQRIYSKAVATAWFSDLDPKKFITV